MASTVDIVNNALNILGASTISSLTEDTKNARISNQRYENVRNRVFRGHPWNCLIKRIQLAQNSTAPVIEYTYAYALPSDFLRVLKIHNGTTDSVASDMPYKIEGTNLITDEATVYLVYVSKDTDSTNYDAYLYEVLAYQLAADMAYGITNNATLAKNLLADADEKLREARFVDSTENSTDSVEADEFTDARL